MIENKMDNELDFRVGDVVCDCRLGTGTVCEIASGAAWIEFGSGVYVRYTLDGKIGRSHQPRALYHGTWDQVFGNLPDLKPKRKVKRWVNLYPDCDNSGFQSGETFVTANEAKLSATSRAVAVAVEIEVDE